jgi:hypothetical protein
MEILLLQPLLNFFADINGFCFTIILLSNLMHKIFVFSKTVCHAVCRMMYNDAVWCIIVQNIKEKCSNV